MSLPQRPYLTLSEPRRVIENVRVICHSVESMSVQTLLDICVREGCDPERVSVVIDTNYNEDTHKIELVFEFETPNIHFEAHQERYLAAKAKYDQEMIEYRDACKAWENEVTLARENNERALYEKLKAKFEPEK